MTKADIVDLIADRTGFTAKDAKIVVEHFIDEIKNCLKEGDHLEIRGFGTFKAHHYKARKARNPKTGEEVMVPNKRKAAFKPSKDFNKILS
jgi:nucleoid DNA-binding protein